MRKILIVIDMQNDFIDGAMGTSEAVTIVPNVIEKIKSYPAENIYATRDTHPENYLETQEGKYLPVRHCIQGTDGWQICTEIAELIPESHIVDKPTFGDLWSWYPRLQRWQRRKSWRLNSSGSVQTSV